MTDKEKDDEDLHPINAVAEYCFGNICIHELQKTMDKNPDWNYKEMMETFNLAISIGLTHDISTGQDDYSIKRREEIWRDVEFFSNIKKYGVTLQGG